MKTPISSVWRLLVCSLETLGLCICGPLASLMPIVPQPDCSRDLSIRVTSNPAHIISGQYSVVSWSVDGPSACLQTSVELNGEPVSAVGNQLVMPPESTTYRITVSYQWNGVPGQKAASARVTVGDALLTPFCPALAVAQAAEIWEPDLQRVHQPGVLSGQWLTEPLIISPTTILPGAEIFWDFGRASDEDTPYTNGPGLAYLSACVLLPEAAVPQVDGLIPEGHDPAAASPAS